MTHPVLRLVSVTSRLFKVTRRNTPRDLCCRREKWRRIGNREEEEEVEGPLVLLMKSAQPCFDLYTMLKYPEVYRNVQDCSGTLGYKFSPVGPHCIAVFAPLCWHKYWNYAHISDNSWIRGKTLDCYMFNLCHSNRNVSSSH